MGPPGALSGSIVPIGAYFRSQFFVNLTNRQHSAGSTWRHDRRIGHLDHGRALPPFPWAPGRSHTRTSDPRAGTWGCSRQPSRAFAGAPACTEMSLDVEQHVKPAYFHN